MIASEVVQNRNHVMFADRRAAGRELASLLMSEGVRADAVLGVAKGGVPVAYEVSSALRLPLGAVAVRKVRLPWGKGDTLGAVCADGHLVVREGVFRAAAATYGNLRSCVMATLREVEQMEASYRQVASPVDLRDATVVLVDDGIATGATMEAAVGFALRQGVARVLVAVPVGTPVACKTLLHGVVAAVHCVASVSYWQPGQGYRDFSAVPDSEVRRLLSIGAPQAHAVS